MREILPWLIPISISTVGFVIILITITSKYLRDFWKEFGYLFGSVLFLSGLALLAFKFFGIT